MRSDDLSLVFGNIHWLTRLQDDTENRLNKSCRTLLQKHGFDKESFITVPVGSLVWATDEQSDYDYQLIFRSNEDSENAYAIFKKDQLWEELKREKVNVVANFPCSADFYIENAAHCANFFFTPDEYIGGNIDLAKELRLKTIQRMDRDNYSQEDWAFVVGSRFDIFFRKWDDLSVHLSWRYKDKKEDVKRDRTRRIKERLKLRANQTHRPKSYIEAFRRSRNEMRIPSFETYSRAMNSTHGSLNLVQRFEAMGINPNLQIKKKFSFGDLLKRTTR